MTFFLTISKKTKISHYFDSGIVNDFNFKNPFDDELFFFELEIFPDDYNKHLAELRNTLSSVLDILRDIDNTLTNINSTLALLTKVIAKNTVVKIKFIVIITQSAIDSLNNFVKIKNVENLEFNILLIKLAFSDNIRTIDILIDTGKNLEKSVYINKLRSEWAKITSWSTLYEEWIDIVIIFFLENKTFP